MKNWRFSTNISLYLENGARYSRTAVTLEDGELVCDTCISNGANFNDLE